MAEYTTKDAVISLFEKWSDGYAYIEIPVQDAIRQVSAIPPADVRPVVRGKWAPHPDPNCKEWDVCTACGTGCKRREYGTNPDGTDYLTEWSYPYCPNCNAEMEAVDVIPADVRPVVRGQWKPFDLTYGRSIYACSSCGESSEVPTVLGKLRYQYCPNCGAEMEVEEDGE